MGDNLTFQGLPASGQAITFELIANGTGFLPSAIPGIGLVLIDEFLRINLNLSGTPVGTDNSSVAVSYVNQGPGSPGIIPEPPDVPFPRGGTYQESARALTGNSKRPGVRPVDDQDRRLSVD